MVEPRHTGRNRNNMDWEKLIEESVIEFIKSQLKVAGVEPSELALRLGVAEGPGGSNEFFLAQVDKDSAIPSSTLTHVHSSGLEFRISNEDKELFTNLALRTAQVATEEGVHTVITFVPRMGVDFNEESDTIEE